MTQRALPDVDSTLEVECCVSAVLCSHSKLSEASSDGLESERKSSHYHRSVSLRASDTSLRSSVLS